MANSEAAFPSVQIQCKDRVRNFCLNLGAFRAMEEHLRAKYKNPEFNILDDFDWASTRLEDVVLMVWGGLFTDSKKDKKPLLVDDVEDIVALQSVAEMRNLIETSLQRMMSPAQYEKVQDETEKKRKEKAKVRAKKNQKRLTS